MNFKTARKYVAILVASVAVLSAVVPVARVDAQGANGKTPIPTPPPQIILPVVPTVAPGYGAPDVAPTAADIIGVTQQPFVGIALTDAVGMALLRNPNLAISASNVTVAHYQVVEAKGPFDVRFRVQPSSNFSATPPTNLFGGGPPLGSPPPGQGGPGYVFEHQSGFQYGLGGQTINGTTYTAGISQQRTYNNTGFNLFNPYYIASLNATVTQPLLRDFGMNENKRNLKLAIVNNDVNVQQTLTDTSNTMTQVEDAYWNLVAAWRNVAIQEEGLKDAVLQMQSNSRLAKQGAAPPIAVVEARTQVANYQDQVFSGLQTVSELQNQLKGLIVSDAGDPIWRANLVPTTSVQQLPTVNDLATIVALANKNRPEVQLAKDKTKQAAIDRAFAKNQSLPRADVSAQYMSNGFAGLLNPQPPFEQLLCGLPQSLGAGTPILVPCPTPPPQTQGTMAYAYHNMWSGLFPTFNINLTVSFPLQNSYANGLKGVAAEEERQAKILNEGVAERIEFEARNALQAYQSALSRLYAARVLRESAEQVYASEQRKFKNGQSTTFLVLQHQTELQQARGRELLAQTDLNKSIVEIERVQGTILANVNFNSLGTQALASPSPLPQH